MLVLVHALVLRRALPANNVAKLWGDVTVADLTLLICLGGGGDEASRVTCKRLPVSKLVLEAHGALRAILGASTPAVEEGGKLPAAVVTVADEEEASAAEAVLRLMYAGDLPAGMSVQQLGRMLHVASRWGAVACTDALLAALMALADGDGVAAVVENFPADVLATWGEKLAGVFFGDVHLLLTTPAMLELFLRLPFEGVLAWARSDGLVVDSENSVVVALDCWVRLGRGKGCSEEQLLQLSGLVRAQHLTPSCLDWTVALPWWCHSKEEMQRFAASGWQEDSEGACGIPAAWLAPPRQQLSCHELRQRTTITSAVPREELEDTLNDPESSYLFSPPVYFAGSSAALGLEIAKADGAKSLRQACAYLCTSAYELDGEEEHIVVPRDTPFALSGYTIFRSMPDDPVAALTVSDKQQLVQEYTDNDPKFSLDPSQLDQELVRGHLVLHASLDPDV